MPNPANPGLFNRFAYVSNNPLKYTDPTGHECLGDSADQSDEECGIATQEEADDWNCGVELSFEECWGRPSPNVSQGPGSPWDPCGGMADLQSCGSNSGPDDNSGINEPGYDDSLVNLLVDIWNNLWDTRSYWAQSGGACFSGSAGLIYGVGLGGCVIHNEGDRFWEYYSVSLSGLSITLGASASLVQVASTCRTAECYESLTKLEIVVTPVAIGLWLNEETGDWAIAGGLGGGLKGHAD